MKSILLIRTAFLLICSNVFMTFAWYSHLRNWSDKKWYIAAILSWGIALFEYLFQVPANRAGYSVMSLAQLKVLQEVITLSVFAPFAIIYMHQPITLDYLWSALCLAGAPISCFVRKVRLFSGAEVAASPHFRRSPMKVRFCFAGACSTWRCCMQR